MDTGIPFSLAATLGGALVAVIGVLWKSLLDSNKRERETMQGYLQFSQSASPILQQANALLADVKEVIEECRKEGGR